MLLAPQDHCFHCHLPLEQDTHLYSIQLLGNSYAMCCPGCQAVAQTIIDQGLEDYYRFRDKPAPTQEPLSTQDFPGFEIFSHPELIDPYIQNENQDTHKKIALLIDGITCAACVWLIEQALSKLVGVLKCQINIDTHCLELTWNPTHIELMGVIKELHRLGYAAQPYTADARQAQEEKQRKQALRRLVVSGFGMMQVMTFAVALYAGAFYGIEPVYKSFFRYLSLCITTPIVFYSGYPFFERALNCFKTKHITMDVPIALAIGLAFFASVWATFTQSGEVYFDSVTMFIFFLTTGRYLEMCARHKASSQIVQLEHVLPLSATKLDGQHQPQKMLVKQLNVGDKVLVKSGEKIPADGRIVQGTSQIDEALLTGEHYPQLKTIGDEVLGGSINLQQPLIVEIMQKPENSQATSILKLLRQGQHEKPTLVKIGDKIAGYFVWSVLIIAALVYGSWLFIDPDKAFWVMLSVLVVTCPCALALATPVALTTATNHLLEKGFLIVQYHVLETLSKITHIIFDKTGTLTYGRFKVNSILKADHQMYSKEARKEVISIAASLEYASDHPVGVSLIRYAHQQMIGFTPATTVQVRLHQGIEGEIDGHLYKIGTSDFVQQHYLKKIPAPTPAHWVALGNRDTLLAWILIDDELRPDAMKLVQSCNALNITPELLSGDSLATVNYVADKLGIHHFEANASPEKKLNYVQQHILKNDCILMIGDGVNDAPVLSQAHVSIAMGNGADISKASADVCLLNNQLSTIPFAIKLARKTQYIIRQNLTWALLYNVLALPLAAMGLIAPYLAALGMSLSSLLVIFNALRLKGKS